MRIFSWSLHKPLRCIVILFHDLSGVLRVAFLGNREFSVSMGVVSVFCVKAFCLLTGIAWCLKSDILFSVEFFMGCIPRYGCAMREIWYLYLHYPFINNIHNHFNHSKNVQNQSILIVWHLGDGTGRPWLSLRIWRLPSLEEG